MTKNMGTADRVVRTLLALAVAVLYFTGKIRGTLAIVLGVFASQEVPVPLRVFEEGVAQGCHSL